MGKTKKKVNKKLIKWLYLFQRPKLKNKIIGDNAIENAIETGMSRPSSIKKMADMWEINPDKLLHDSLFHISEYIPDNIYTICLKYEIKPDKTKKVLSCTKRNSEKIGLSNPIIINNFQLINKYIQDRNNTQKYAYTHNVKSLKLNIEESFYDDSDLIIKNENINFYIHLLYKNDLCILSTRTYTNIKLIYNEISYNNGNIDNFSIKEQKNLTYSIEDKVSLSDEENEVFAIDRLSAQYFTTPLMFGVLYKELLLEHSNCKYIYALARRENKEKLLNNYIKLGFNIIGETKYTVCGMLLRHWVLRGDINQMKRKYFKNNKITDQILSL